MWVGLVIGIIVMVAFPDSTAAEQYRALADKIAELCGMGEEK